MKIIENLNFIHYIFSGSETPNTFIPFLITIDTKYDIRFHPFYFTIFNKFKSIIFITLLQ